MTARPLPHLLLVNLGTPVAATPEAVREFLDEFLSDPAVIDLPRAIWQPILHGMVLRKRPERVARLYASIWSPQGSPLRVATERIAQGVGALAAGRATVSVAYRYGEPSIPTELGRLAAAGVPRVAVVPLFAQRTDATTGTVVRLAREVASRLGVGDRVVGRFIAPADPGFVRALADRWRTALSALDEPPQHVVVSYHGIPVRYDRREGRLYSRECAATTQALLTAVNWPADRATLAYQSRFGPEPWLKPATDEVLARLARNGTRRVAIIAPGFITEGLETLEELAIRGRETFQENGGEAFTYIPAVEDALPFLESLAALSTADEE